MRCYVTLRKRACLVVAPTSLLISRSLSFYLLPSVPWRSVEDAEGLWDRGLPQGKTPNHVHRHAHSDVSKSRRVAPSVIV